MRFKDLQRLLTGGSTEKEKRYLLTLLKHSKGREILSIAFDEGWKKAVNEKEANWDSRSCFRQLLGKVTSDRDSIKYSVY